MGRVHRTCVHFRQAKSVLNSTYEKRTIDIVFTGPPPRGRLVEVERDGKSVDVGEWIHREDG